jgi:hypothetical protein
MSRPHIQTEGKTMTTTALARHIPSGEVYGLRYDRDEIIMVAGPLSHRDMGATHEDTLENLEFSDEDAAWANRQRWSTLEKNTEG